MYFATKRIGPSCCTLFTFIACYPLQIILSQNYLLPTISVLAENTLLKTACHFLLLLIGFDTLTYRKDYDRSPILVGHHPPGLAATIYPPRSSSTPPTAIATAAPSNSQQMHTRRRTRGGTLSYLLNLFIAARK